MLKLAPEKHAERLALYEQGLDDGQIAKALGVVKKTIFDWRQLHGLPTRNSVHFSPEQHAARTLLYQMGYSDARIAREQRVGWRRIQAWRKRRDLPAHDFNIGGRWSRSSLKGDTVLDRIKRAIGRALPRDVADDAVSDLYVAVLTGAVALDRIEAEARKFGNRVLNQFASKFGPRSLDEEIGDSDGFTLLDKLRDEGSSDWLEQMGATVW